MYSGGNLVLAAASKVVKENQLINLNLNLCILVRKSALRLILEDFNIL
jgi:hypothetical protein